jgi:hypothetical protein
MRRAPLFFLIMCACSGSTATIGDGPTTDASDAGDASSHDAAGSDSGTDASAPLWCDTSTEQGQKFYAGEWQQYAANDTQKYCRYCGNSAPLDCGKDQCCYREVGGRCVGR